MSLDLNDENGSGSRLTPRDLLKIVSNQAREIHDLSVSLAKIEGLPAAVADISSKLDAITERLRRMDQRVFTPEERDDLRRYAAVFKQRGLIDVLTPDELDLSRSALRAAPEAKALAERNADRIDELEDWQHAHNLGHLQADEYVLLRAMLAEWRDFCTTILPDLKNMRDEWTRIKSAAGVRWEQIKAGFAVQALTAILLTPIGAVILFLIHQATGWP